MEQTKIWLLKITNQVWIFSKKWNDHFECNLFEINTENMIKFCQLTSSNQLEVKQLDCWGWTRAQGKLKSGYQAFYFFNNMVKKPVALSGMSKLMTKYTKIEVALNCKNQYKGIQIPKESEVKFKRPHISRYFVLFQSASLWTIKWLNVLIIGTLWWVIMLTLRIPWSLDLHQVWNPQKG